MALVAINELTGYDIEVIIAVAGNPDLLGSVLNPI